MDQTDILYFILNRCSILALDRVPVGTWQQRKRKTTAEFKKPRHCKNENKRVNNKIRMEIWKTTATTK